jgi:hypothetical protein
VSDRTPPVDDVTMKVGLLMEGAQTHQRLAETHLERLDAHTRDLDEVVRDSVRRTVVEEFRELTAESQRAIDTLRGVKRAAEVRLLLWTLVSSMLSTAVPLAAVRWILPSAEQIDVLREQRDRLASNVAQLEKRGGRIEWRRCGEQARLCVQVDRSAPSYGDKGDFVVPKGY